MSTQPVVINIENPKKTWSSKRKKTAITKRWYKKGSSKSARRRKKTIHSRGKTKSNSKIRLDNLRGRTQSNSSGKTRSKTRKQLDELYKAFISCEPNCVICDKYILDFSQHFKLTHTHIPIPSYTDENLDGLDSDSDDSDDFPLHFYVTKKTKEAKAGSRTCENPMRRINMTRKRKLIKKVGCETAADLGIPSNSDASHISEKQPETSLSNINSDEYVPPLKILKSKCGRSLRVKKKIDYAEILNRNAEVENPSEDDKITLKSRELSSHTENENPNPTTNFVIVLENIKSDPGENDQDQEIVIPEELDFDHMALSELGQINHSHPYNTTEDLGHLSQLVTESTHQG